MTCAPTKPAGRTPTGPRGPSWLRPPADVNALVPLLWSSTARKNDDGALEVGGVDLRDLVAEHGSPAYVLDEADFRGAGPGLPEAFGDYDVYYAGKAFLCTTVARWVAEEGLCLDVCSAGELTVALRAGFDPARIGYHGNNKTTDELRRAVEAGVGRIVVDSFHEIDRLAAVTAEPARTAARDGAGDRRRRGAHPRVHRHRPRGPEVRLLDHLGRRAGRRTPGARRRPASSCSGCTRTSARRSSTPPASRSPPAGCWRCTPRSPSELGVTMPELDLGGGFGIAYTTQDDPSDPAQLATELTKIVEHECRALRRRRCPRCRSSPAGRSSGPAMCTVYEVGTVKAVELDAGARRTYVSVDGGMSDNIRTALYDADYSCTLASRRSDAAPVLGRVVGKHCEAGDIVVKDEFVPGDIAPGDLLAVPGTGAYCRSMASNYNHALRPPVVAVRDGASTVVVRRETEDDLLRTDVGA